MAIVAVDFDGVLYPGWFYAAQNGSGPIKGAVAAIKELREMGYEIVVLTARSNYDDYATEKAYMQKYFGFTPRITNEKPTAHYYIDDNAIRFESWGETMDLIKRRV